MVDSRKRYPVTVRDVCSASLNAPALSSRWPRSGQVRDTFSPAERHPAVSQRGAQITPILADFYSRTAKETARHPDGWRAVLLQLVRGSAGGRGPFARLLGEPGGFVVDLYCHLRQRVCMLAVVVPAEEKFGRPGEYHSNVRRRTAPVTQVVGVQWLRWG